MIKVAVAGNFYPLHDGHINHFKEARKLGDYLVAIIGSDKYLENKGKQVFSPLENRKSQLKAWVDEVIEVVDTDGTVAKTLKRIRPAVYAKSGDRTLETMPKNEIEVCKEIGCRIVYGVGNTYDTDGQFMSSSKILRRIKE